MNEKIIKNVLDKLDKKQVQDLMFNGRKFHPIHINDKKYLIIDAQNTKVVIGEDYNFTFDKTNGNFMRWGETYEVDPQFSPIGGEILDIEITTSCKGVPNNDGVVIPCKFCYKSNTPVGENMSLETFKTIMGKMGPQLTQVAFGADSTGTSNPDLWAMADFCRQMGIVPNLTIANVSDEIADKIVAALGACAVSRYENKNICYDSIKKLTDRGMKQVNMHFCIAEEMYDACIETLNDIKTDPRLANLNAIVLLSLKQKGRGETFTPLAKDKYEYLVNFCLGNKINFGMDSCGATRFLNAVKDHPNYKNFKVVCEPCESTDFSQYIDVKGDFYPCSFCEDIVGWEKGINVTSCRDFLKDIWYNERVVEFRAKLNSNCNNCHGSRECPIYKI